LHSEEFHRFSIEIADFNFNKDTDLVPSQMEIDFISSYFNWLDTETDFVLSQFKMDEVVDMDV
jgi:hypothetical protein